MPTLYTEDILLQEDWCPLLFNNGDRILLEFQDGAWEAQAGAGGGWTPTLAGAQTWRDIDERCPGG